MTANAKLIIGFMKENYGMDITAQEIAKELNVSLGAVTATVNNLVKKDLGFRNAVSTTDAEGKEVVTKYVGLNEAGRDFDFEADEAAKAAKKAKKAE